MKLLKRSAILVSLLLLTGIVLAPSLVGAADTATVTATVTPKLVSVTVSPTSVAYGTVPLSSSATSGVITATNDGNVTETFNIKGADATYSTNTWVLSDTAVGANQYMHKFALPTYITWTPLSTTYLTLATGIAASGTQDFKLQIWTPTSTTLYGEYSTTVTVLATG